jgi:hypothetical protein
VESELLQNLEDKSITKFDLYKNLTANFGLLPEVIKGVSSSKAAVRYGCSSILVDLTANYPEKLYPQMEMFCSLLDSKYRIIKWNAMAAIANLCSFDSRNKFDEIFDKYFGFLSDEYLVTVANVVDNSAKIALAKPYLIPKIVQAVLNVENISITPHLTEECKRVIAEHAIKSFNVYFDKLDRNEKGKVISFIKRQCESSRKTLKAEAQTFLKNHNL